jgi:hypothetical protein
MPAFKVDENLPEEIAGLLRVAGYDATTVVTERRSGCKDPDLIDVCRLEGPPATLARSCCASRDRTKPTRLPSSTG